MGLEMNYDLKRESLYEVIADKLETAILNDSTQLEKKLPSEQALASSFGVSRPVIREALKLLKARGLVDQKNGEGNFICEPKPVIIGDAVSRIVKLRRVHVTDIIEMRIQFEIMGIRLAAERITERQLCGLEEINKEMNENKANIELRTDLDMQFHQKIAESSGNAVLSIFLESLAVLIRPMVKAALSLPLTNEDGIIYHKRIIHALKTHNRAEAEDLIRGHLISSFRNYEVSDHSNKAEGSEERNGTD